ncbi:RNA polymerase II transcriptional coactivator [Contarinia nasturtii]|uniref:RNA polymerase II transcriptional coactivator n=1 Tax=Contarinia nasturtii TaxID=265458 RepID=UPI0012D3E97F|nr:RNA polymerase II transcriptional coactivator [Contarinia nasturtii]
MPKKKAAESSSDSDSGPDDRTPVKKAKKTDEGFSLEFGKNRRVTVSEFKGKVYVNIREYYNKDGAMVPGKKGISLTPEQWKTILERQTEINDAIKEL